MKQFQFIFAACLLTLCAPCRCMQQDTSTLSGLLASLDSRWSNQTQAQAVAWLERTSTSDSNAPKNDMRILCTEMLTQLRLPNGFDAAFPAEVVNIANSMREQAFGDTDFKQAMQHAWKEEAIDARGRLQRNPQEYAESSRVSPMWDTACKVAIRSYALRLKGLTEGIVRLDEGAFKSIEAFVKACPRIDKAHNNAVKAAFLVMFQIKQTADRCRSDAILKACSGQIIDVLGPAILAGFDNQSKK